MPIPRLLSLSIFYFGFTQDARRFWSTLVQLREVEKMGINGGKHLSPPSTNVVATAAGDMFVELEGAHHAFGYVDSPRSFVTADAISDFIFHVSQLKSGTSAKL